MPDGDEPMMMTVVSGSEGNRIETLSDEQVKDEIHYHLSTVFAGHTSSTENLKPTNVHVCKWTTDPRFYGAYSFLRTGCFNENPVFYHWLTEPVSCVAGGQK